MTVLGLLFSWVGYAIILSLAFNGNFVDQLLFFNLSGESIFLHVVVFLDVSVAGVYCYRILIRRAQLEKDLQESEQRWATTLASIGDAVISTNTSGKIVFMNNEAEKLTGWKLNEAYLKPLNESFKNVDEQTHLVVEAPVSKMLEKGMIVGLTNHTILIRKDGAEFAIDKSAAAVKDKDGKTTGVVLVFRDVTERKKAEQKSEEKNQLIESMNEKLRVVGSLTRHDVGNKLMAAKSNLYLLKKQIGDNPKLTKYVENAKTALASSDRIFEFSRLYEKIGVEKPSRENVFYCFNQAVALMQNLSDVEVVNECKGLEVVADSLLKQLFYNFIDNSLKHGEKVTQIRLHYTREDDGVNLFYEDDGIGVPEANKSKLFETGFTTGKGCGLGLSLIKKMMDVYGWTITEEGEVGKGAKFVISMPNSSVSSF